MKSLVACLTVSMFLAAPALASSDERGAELSPNALLAYGSVDRAMQDLSGFLQAIGFEKSALIGTNYFGVSVGGIDAIRDLEEGRGVDPETFAGLHAGFARPEVAAHLNLEKNPDPQGRIILSINAPDGRLRYKGTVVRIYSRQRLRELFDRRASFRANNERKRREAFSTFVNRRRREVGAIDRSATTSEVSEMSERFRQLMPLFVNLESVLQSELEASSIMESSEPHVFGLSVGGINVVRVLNEQHTVDPETLGAIYAGRLSTDYAESIELGEDGRIQLAGNEIKLAPVSQLQEYFRFRDRLSLQSN